MADFHNVGMTPDFNDELNKCTKGVDSSSAVYFSLVLSLKKKRGMKWRSRNPPISTPFVLVLRDSP